MTMGQGRKASELKMKRKTAQLKKKLRLKKRIAEAKKQLSSVAYPILLIG